MPKLNSQSPKVQVPGRFGGTEQIALDTNRVTTHNETLYKAANTVSLKADSFYSDMLMWVLVPSFSMRVIKLFVIAGLPTSGALALIALLLAPPLLLISYVLLQAPGSHTMASFYRLALIAAGLCLAVL